MARSADGPAARPRWRPARAVAASLAATLALVALPGLAAGQAPSSGSSTTTATTASPTSDASTTASTAAPTTAPATSAEATTSTLPAVADPPGTPLPAPLVAPAPPSDDDVPRPVRLEGFHVAPGLGDQQPQVVVTFAQLFPLPEDPWRVSVLVGDPSGTRRRLSLVAEGGATTGSVEEGQDGSWSTVGDLDLDVAFDPSGLVSIPLDVADVPPGPGDAPPAIWVEAVLGDEGADGAVRRSTGWYDLPSVLGEGAPGLLRGGRLVPLPAAGTDEADEVDGSDAPGVADLGPGPVLGLAREADATGAVVSTIVLRYDDAAPRALDGVGVREVIDRIQVAPDGVDGATVTPYIEIDRTSGRVRLVDPRQWPVVDATGDASWQLADASVGDPGGPSTLSFDLDAVLGALGAAPERATVALGLTRTERLLDDRVVVAEGVLGTTAWLDTAVELTVPRAAPAPVPATAVPEEGGDDGGPPVAALAVMGALVLVGASLVVSGRRRRATRRALAESEAPSPAAAPAAPAVEPGDGAGARSAIHDQPRWRDDHPPAPEPEPEPGHPPEPEPDHPPAPEPSASTSADERVPWWRTGAAGHLPEEPVAAPDPPPERPRHHAEGVTIDAALVTDLVDGSDESVDPADSDATGGPDRPDGLDREIDQLAERLRRLDEGGS